MGKTYMPTKEAVQEGDLRKWWLVDGRAPDGKGYVLGRLAARLATILQGKHKPIYTPHVDTGDFVVVTHVEKVRVTGKKAQTKVYQRFSGYPGGLKETSYAQMLERKPEEILRLAVRRMLPKNRLGRQMLKKLKIYAGAEHPHEAQQPEALEI